MGVSTKPIEDSNQLRMLPNCAGIHWAIRFKAATTRSLGGSLAEVTGPAVAGAPGGANAGALVHAPMVVSSGFVSTLPAEGTGALVLEDDINCVAVARQFAGRKWASEEFWMKFSARRRIDCAFRGRSLIKFRLSRMAPGTTEPMSAPTTSNPSSKTRSTAQT